MSRTKHTAGKWWWSNESPQDDAMEFTGGRVPADYDGYAIVCASPEFIIYSKGAKAGFPSKSRQKADVKRIVTCVNALDGLNPDAVLNLLQVCKAIVEEAEKAGSPTAHQYMYRELVAAIAKTEGNKT